MKRKKEEIRLEERKNESNVKMRKSGVAETADLGAYLQRMYPCEWEAEVDYFLRGSQNRRFGGQRYGRELTAPKKIIYFCLPFTGIHSLQIRTQISRLCNAAFPHLDIRFVFRSSRRISSFFPFKDKVPKYLRSSVVYLFKCRCCSASYVGQTTRHLHTRISEHLGISPITGKTLDQPCYL